MEHTVTVMQWYVVSGTAGATVSTPEGVILCTVPDGGQGTFYATTPKVVTSDDSVTVVKATFKSAPAKLRLLGLLGGGVSAGLPSGYLAAEFLESTGSQYIDTGYKPNSEFGVYFDVQEVTTPSGYVWYCGAQVSGSALWLDSQERLAIRNGRGGYGAFWLEETKSEKNRVQAVANLYNDLLYGKVGEAETGSAVPTQDLSFTLFRSHYKTAGNFDATAPLRMFAFKLTTGTELMIDFVPYVDANGVPCMFNKVSKQPFYNSGSGAFIVGMTLEQARKLGKLPEGGGTLTISLPSNWQEDAGVVDALATAEAKGWVFTYQTYEAEAGAASTFALRRIWVRKTQDDGGGYVAADGSRWLVEWCAGMIGADPQEYGYEPYRSVDAAVAYWGLEPYVYPEEELLTETTTNEHE